MYFPFSLFQKWMDGPYVNSVPANTQGKPADALGEEGVHTARRICFTILTFHIFTTANSLSLCPPIYSLARVRSKYRNHHIDNSKSTFVC